MAEKGSALLVVEEEEDGVMVSRLLHLLGTLNSPWQGEDMDEKNKQVKKLHESYVERTWDKRYFLSEPKETSPSLIEEREVEKTDLAASCSSSCCEDRFAYLHPNGMCVLGLAATHDAVVQARTRGGIPCSMAYNKKWDAAKGVQVTGKKRKDACVTQADTEVCVLKCGDREFSVRCGVKGKLIELNPRLLPGNEPDLWFDKPATEGWLAVVQLLSKAATKEVSGDWGRMPPAGRFSPIPTLTRSPPHLFVPKVLAATVSFEEFARRRRVELERVLRPLPG